MPMPITDLGLGYHVTIRLFDRRVIAPLPWQRRVAMESILRIGADYQLLAASLPDNHGHLEAVCSRAQAGQLQRRIGTSLRKRLDLPVGFESYEPRPLQNPWHRENCLRYVISQNPHHELQWDPYYEATSFPDLIGARITGRYTAENVLCYLPRLKVETLYQWLDLEPLDPAELRHAPAAVFEGIRDATLRAGGLIELHRKVPAQQAARSAAVAVLGDRVTQRQAAHLLGLARSTIQRARNHPADPRLVRAIELQLVWSQHAQAPRTLADP